MKKELQQWPVLWHDNNITTTTTITTTTSATITSIFNNNNNDIKNLYSALYYLLVECSKALLKH